MNIIGLVCARGGSKGIKNKNLLKINNISLVGRSVIQAKKSFLINKVYISSDSIKIIREAKKYGAIVPFLRPKKLSGDNVPEILVWRHFVNYLIKENIKVDYVVSIPTTAPLRLISDINQCIKKAIENKCDFVLVSSKAKRNPYFNMVKYKKNNKISLVCEKKNNKFYRRQDAPKCFDLTTVCYVFKPNYILNSYDLFSGNTDMIIIPNSRALDIDDLFDYKISKLLLNDKK